jgi:truncated hemoglobin YjbI
MTGEVLKLSEPAEEVATFYAKMLEHDYTTKEVFNKNFLQDWRKVIGQQCFVGMETYVLEMVVS